MISILFVLAALIVSSGAAFAATYSVATNGSDTNPGSTTQPWRTIQKAVDTLQAGDTVIVKAGTYAERVATKRDGTTNNPISIRSAGTVIMRGFDLSHDFIVVEGFEITGAPTIPFNGAIRIMPSAAHCLIVSNYIHDLSNDVYGIEFEPGGTAPGSSAQRCIIQHNRIVRPGFHMLILYGSGHLVEGNLFDKARGDAIRCFGSSHVIRQNTFTRIDISDAGHPDIIQTFGNTGHPAYDILFEQNVCRDSSGQICQLEQNGVADIRDWTFRNNLLIRMDAQANIDIPGVSWINNLFYQCTRNTAHVLSYVWYDPSVPGNRGQAYRGKVLNNIFLECGVDPANNEKGWYMVNTNLTDFVADHNYVAGVNFAPKKAGFARSAFVFYERNGVNGGDPSLESITNLNFRLRTGSRLIDAGTNWVGLTNDFLNTPRLQNSRIDIGPYENVNRPPPPGNFRLIPR